MSYTIYSDHQEHYHLVNNSTDEISNSRWDSLTKLVEHCQSLVYDVYEGTFSEYYTGRHFTPIATFESFSNFHRNYPEFFI